MDNCSVKCFSDSSKNITTTRNLTSKISYASDIVKYIEDTYDIGVNGFAPNKCVTKLPKEFMLYKPMIVVLSTENGQIFRDLVDDIKLQYTDIPSTDNLEISEKKYLYSVLSMIVHKYVWCCGMDNIKTTIPQIIGQPWLEVSNSLGLPTVLTHAAVDLYNWSVRHKDKPLSLDNLKSNHLILGNNSEEWFYLVMVAIECASGNALRSVYSIYNELQKGGKNDDKFILDHMCVIRDTIRDIISILVRMEEKCDKAFFFHELRIYLKGSNEEKENGDKYFPDGLKIENLNHREISYNGGSAAQSSVIQVFDILFGITHKDKDKVFLDKMRNYMPQKHRDFLLDMENMPSFMEFVKYSKNIELYNITHESISLLQDFRNAHLHIVGEYIFKFVREIKKKAKEQMEKEQPENTVPAKIKTKEISNKGTGGTNPETFLPNVIHNTGNAIRDLQESIKKAPFPSIVTNELTSDNISNQSEIEQSNINKIQKPTIKETAEDNIMENTIISNTMNKTKEKKPNADEYYYDNVYFQMSIVTIPLAVMFYWLGYIMYNPTH